MIIDTGNTIGVKRHLDNLGRVVLPKEFRKVLDLKEEDSVEIFLLKNGLYIKVFDI